MRKANNSPSKGRGHTHTHTHGPPLPLTCAGRRPSGSHGSPVPPRPAPSRGGHRSSRVFVARRGPGPGPGPGAGPVSSCDAAGSVSAAPPRCSALPALGRRSAQAPQPGAGLRPDWLLAAAGEEEPAAGRARRRGRARRALAAERCLPGAGGAALRAVLPPQTPRSGRCRGAPSQRGFVPLLRLLIVRLAPRCTGSGLPQQSGK